MLGLIPTRSVVRNQLASCNAIFNRINHWIGNILLDLEVDTDLPSLFVGLTGVVASSAPLVPVGDAETSPEVVAPSGALLVKRGLLKQLLHGLPRALQIQEINISVRPGTKLVRGATEISQYSCQLWIFALETATSGPSFNFGNEQNTAGTVEDYVIRMVG